MAKESCRDKSRANFDDHIKKKLPLVAASFSSVMAKYYLLALLCVALYSSHSGQRGISGSAILNSTSSIKPPQPQPPTGLKNATSSADQLAQEQRLALQIITTDSLDSEPQVIERSHHGSLARPTSTTLQRAASSSSMMSNNNNNGNNKIERLSSSMDPEADSMLNNGAITFDEQLGLIDNQLRKNKESPVSDQFAKTPKRIIINLNTEHSGGSNSSQSAGSKGTKITIGFADERAEVKSSGKPPVGPSRHLSAGSSLAAGFGQRSAGHSASPDMRRPLVEALHRQGGVPTLIVGQAGEPKEAPRVKLMVNAELIDQVQPHQQHVSSRSQQALTKTAKVTRPMQSSASSPSSLANDITLREAIENLSNEINSLEKQFDQADSAGSTGRPAESANEQDQQQASRESLSKLGSSASGQSISSAAGDQHQQQPVQSLIGSSEEQPLDTLSAAENLQQQQQQQQNDLIDHQQNQGYLGEAHHGKHLLLSNDNAIVAREEDEEGLSEVADDSFADSNQSRLRALHEAEEPATLDRSSETQADDFSQDQQQVLQSSSRLQQQVHQQPQQRVAQVLQVTAGSDEVADNNNAQGGQNYESARTQLADKLRVGLEKVDLSTAADANALPAPRQSSARQYSYKSSSLLMDNSLAGSSNSAGPMSGKAPAEAGYEAGLSELASHGSALSAKLSPAKQVSLSPENLNEPMDERVARILEELKLYTTKEQLVKVVRDLVAREEAQDNQQPPVAKQQPIQDAAASEQRNPRKLSAATKRNQRRATLELAISGQASPDVHSWPRQDSSAMQQEARVRARKSFQASAESQPKMAPQIPVYQLEGGSSSSPPLGGFEGVAAPDSNEKESHLADGKSIKQTQTGSGGQRRRWMRDVDSRMLWDFRKRHSNLKAMLESSESATREAENQRELGNNNEIYLTEATPSLAESNESSSSHNSAQTPSNHNQNIPTDEADSQLAKDGPSPEEYTTDLEYPTPSGVAHLRQQQEATIYSPHHDQQHQQVPADTQSPEASRSIESYLPASGAKELRSDVVVEPPMSEEESKLRLKGIAEIKAIEQIIDELVRRNAKEKAAAAGA